MPKKRKKTTKKQQVKDSFALVAETKQFVATMLQRLLSFTSNRLLLVSGVLLAVIVVFSLLSFVFPSEEPAVADDQQEPAALVRTYDIGETPRVEYLAQVANKGVITIVAQTNGVVQQLPVGVGDSVYRGQNVTNLSTSYGGGNALVLQRQLAQKQFEFARDTYQTELEITADRRRIAEESFENADTLREISEKTKSDTEDLIDLNDTILDTIEEQIDAASTSAELQAARQLKSQLLSANVQLKNSQRTLDFTSDEDNAPAQLQELNKSVALKQLAIAEQSLQLNKEVSELNYKLARVNESLSFPSAPFAGVVQRVHVRPGQSVSPGTPLVTIDCDAAALEATALVPAEVAAQITALEPARIQLRDTTIELYPTFISTEATHGQQFSVVFSLPESLDASVTDKEFVTISLPVGTADTSAAIPLVPLEAVHQTEQQASVFVLEDDRAISQVVDLGRVYGGYVVIESGITPGQRIILDRFVVADQLVRTE